MGRGGGQGGRGKWGGNQHSKAVEEKEVCEIFPGRRQSSELWLPGGHPTFVSLAGLLDLVYGSVSQYDSVDVPQLPLFRLTQNTHLKGTFSP